MPGRTATLLAAAGAIAALGLGLGVTGMSSATYVSSSANSAVVSAAPDWTPPSVTLTQPPAAVRGTVVVGATASDAGSGVAAVEIQVRAVGADGWSTLCTDPSAPYSCSWDTTARPDGDYDLRARATDKAGYTAASAPARTVIVNAARVTLADPGDFVSGTVPLTATLSAGAGAGWTVRVERATLGTSAWQTVCTANSGAPYTCSWVTSGTGRFDLRAVATVAGITLVSTTVPDTLVDNTAPSASVTVPAGPLRGVVTLAATSTDAHSGVAGVVLQAASSASGPYADLCSDATSPYSCQYDTTALPYGAHWFRAVATDRAGNRTTSAVVGPRQVDNTTRSITLADPGSFLEGTVTLSATPAASAGIASVTIQRAPAGGSTWTTLCTPNAAPWSCAWDTRSVADGSYDLRAVVTDVNGQTATSTVLSARRVDNTATGFRGVDVQGVNGGATAGRLEAGDTTVLTFSRRVDLGTITPGWNGEAIPITVTVRDSGWLEDDLEFTRAGSTLNLGYVRVGTILLNLVPMAVLDATMTATTETVGGVPRTVVTIRADRLVSGALRTTIFASDMTWHPSAAVRSLNGLTSATTAVAESGADDREF